MRNWLNIRSVIFCILPAMSLLQSCTKTETREEMLDMGYAYFPTDSAWVKIYRVDSISFSDNTQSSDTFQFLLKEEFIGSTQASGIDNHRIIKRSVQFPNIPAWEPRSSHFVLTTAQNLQQVIDNQRIVKLVFPIGKVQSWNGNSYNSLGKRNFYWENLFVTHAVSDTVYAPSVTVIEAKINNFVEEVFISSTYAKGVGLIEFKTTNLSIQTSGISGYKIHQKLIDYKKP
jgi:hypothetical protein